MMKNNVREFKSQIAKGRKNNPVLVRELLYA